MGLRQAVNNAKNGSQSQSNQQQEPNINTGSGQAGQQTGQAFLDNFKPAVQAMSNSIVEYVTVEALKDAMQRLSRGELSANAINMMNNFTAAATNSLDAEVVDCLSWENSPKALPPSPAESPES